MHHFLTDTFVNKQINLIMFYILLNYFIITTYKYAIRHLPYIN